jgi:hypothetical protein
LLVSLLAPVLAVPTFAAGGIKDTIDGDRNDPHFVKQWRDQDDRLGGRCSSGLVGIGNGSGGNDTDGDGVADRCDAFVDDPSRSGPFHIGVIDSLDDVWQTLLAPGRYQNPVVIFGPPSFNDSEPGIVQLDRVSALSFDVRFAEWAYLDGYHEAESVPYILAEAGRYEMDDGSVWELGNFDRRNLQPLRDRTFSEPLPGVPALFLTLQTSNGADPAIARARDVTAEGFRIRMFEEEGLQDGHTLESVGYLAVYSPNGSGTISVHGLDVPYLLQTAAVDHKFVPAMSWNLIFQEEQSVDQEIYHRPETFSLLNLGGLLFGQDSSMSGGDPATLRRRDPVQGTAMEWGNVDNVDDRWIKVPLAKSYTNPVVVVAVASSRDTDPGMPRIRNVSAGSFELHFDEWMYQDGLHAGERVFYIVADEGQHDLEGLTVEAGTLTTSGTLDSEGWNTVGLTASFLGVPGVFTSLQTTTSDIPTVTRVDQPAAGSFRVTMQEEEGSVTDGHSPEALGWIAIDTGRVVSEDGRSIEVISRRVDGQLRMVHFTPKPGLRMRTVVADVVSVKEADAVSLRHGFLGTNRMEIMLQEEQSLDLEMTHVREDVCFFVAE